jgi:SAM-dependent methyltransferase
MLAAGKDDLMNILDLPCGHGRVLRTLKAAFPEAGITACDLNRDGVDFCARAFGATPVYARKLPEEIQIESSFDLIWCGSLLTHLDFERWPGFLRLFQSLLVPDGILVFTTHGRWIAERLRAGTLNIDGIPHKALHDLLTSYDRDGFSYEVYELVEDFGISISSPSWVCRQLEKIPNLRLLNYTEKGWYKHQDAVACVKV